MDVSPVFTVALPLLFVALTVLSRRYQPGSKENRLLRLSAVLAVVPILYAGYEAGTWTTLATNVHDRMVSSPAPHTPLGYGISATQAAAVASAASQAKPAIADFYQSQNRLPRGSELGGLPPGARLLPNGALEVTANGDPSTAVHWRLSVNEGGSVGWNCVTRRVVNVSDYLHDCRYDQSFNENQPIIAEYVQEDQVRFALGEAGRKGLRRSDAARLQDLFARIAGSQVVAVEVSGFADPTGSAEMTVGLAESRARFVRESLVAAGVERALIETRVVGADPAAPRHCLDLKSRQERIDCLSQSRRVDFKIKARRTL